MRLRYGEVEAVLSAIHGPGAKPTAMLGRLKYLQRFGWPAGGAKGQGSRAGYGLAQILGLAAALELMETGMTPLRVLRLLRTSWSTMLPALVIGWANAEWDLAPVFLALSPRALAELGVEDDPSRPSPDVFEPITAEGIIQWTMTTGGMGGSLYLLNPVLIVTELASVMPDLKLATGDEISNAFLSLGEELFGSNAPRTWTMEDAWLRWRKPAGRSHDG